MRTMELELKDLKGKILSQGGFVERALEEATELLIQKDLNRFKNILEFENYVNKAHVEIDELCINLMAQKAPMAGDLRLIFSAIKINGDLERMGDQCVNIAYNAEHFIKSGCQSDFNQIRSMARIAREMLRDVLNAFVFQDVSGAQNVLKRDDELDHLKNQVFDSHIEKMKLDPSLIEVYINLILIARNLERLGDHATNIAEDIIFTSTGEDVRHGRMISKKESSTNE